MKIMFELLIWIIFMLPNYISPQTTQSHLNTITEFHNSIITCQTNLTDCASYNSLHRIITLSAKLANEFSVLLLHEGIDGLFNDALNLLPKNHVAYAKISHIRSIIHFSQGYTNEAQKAWEIMNSSDIAAKRSLGIQMIITGQEVNGFQRLNEYCSELSQRFIKVVNNSFQSNSKNSPHRIINYQRAPSSSKSEELLLAIFLNEVQGGVHLRNKRGDVVLCSEEFRSIDAEQRFRLGVGLAKLGLYDLSLRHVSMSATPWESPLFNLRARLVFQPLHGSIRSLAMTVDNFEKMCETILTEKVTRSSMMDKTCNSLNQISLATQALPLLHLAGYSSPRDELLIGHSAVALPVLLSEVYSLLCASNQIPTWIKTNPIRSNGESHIQIIKASQGKENRIIKIGFVSGSFDGLSGKLVLALISPGLVENIRERDGITLVLTALCLPTPRSHLTDLVNEAFQTNINLPPDNKTEAIIRIRQTKQDFLIFADAGLDSRVFALAHERMAPYQAILWGWGGTLGIPSIDYYLVPEPLWKGASCALMKTKGSASLLEEKSGVAISTDSVRKESSSEVLYKVSPQELFREQVVLLDELPFLPLGEIAPKDELDSVLKDRFRIPPLNESNIYLFPGSVRHMHPEFDEALAHLLKTDMNAYVIVTLPRMGRDSLPTTHIAGRHDLMHPTHPPAAVEKLKHRLKSVIGKEPASRVRILPPLDEKIFSTLLLNVVAVLDPYPVGMHVSITEALLRGVPVVSAPKLQECTNSHTFGIAKSIGIVGPGNDRDSWPSTPEEYAVFAIKLRGDRQLRKSFLPPMTNAFDGQKQIGSTRWLNPNNYSFQGLQMILDLVERIV